jgi:hypothetical protein
MTTAPTYTPVVTRTDQATYIYLPTATATGAAFLECIGVARWCPRRHGWEVRIPMNGRGGWAPVRVHSTRAAAEDHLGELKGVPL